MKKNIFFVLLVLLTGTLWSQNLVVNPGLEVWGSSTNPTGWPTSSKCTAETGIYHSGLFSCLHTGTTTRGDLGQTIIITPGETYTLSLWYLTGATSTGSGARVWCYWKDSGGASIIDPATDDLLRSTAYLSSSAWAQFTVTVTAPLNAIAFYLEVRTYPSSVTYWDDFVFEETVPTGAENDHLAETTIFPVPAGDMINIKDLREAESIDILDITGSVRKTFITGKMVEISLPVNDLENGVYFLRLRYNRNVVVKKFIKK